MSSFGPQIPASLTKRKRDGEDDEAQSNKHRRGDTNKEEIALDDSDDDDDYGPAVPNGAIGPSLPAANGDEIDLDDSDDDYGPSASAPAPAPSKAPSRSMGPARPPSNKEEIDLDDSDSDTGPAPPKPPSGPARPLPATFHPDSESSDSEDDYGPALPNSSNAAKRSIGPQLPPTEAAPQRDEWMLAPPTSSGYAERDPTRMKNRKFASKSSSGPSTVSSIWTETPEEKLKRLQDSVLGREDKTQENSTASARTREEEEEREQKIAAKIKASRGKSLFDEHQSRKQDAGEKVEEEDDPSKRGFDREKDMALGGKIGTSQRRELMNKAANFGGRFSKGSFL